MQPRQTIDLERIELESDEAKALLDVLESQRTDTPADADAALGPRFTAAGAKMQ